jgi:hypothetical protein
MTELTDFIEREQGVRTAVAVSKLPIDSNVEHRRSYLPALQNLANKDFVPGIVKTTALTYDNSTSQSKLDATAGGLNRIFEDRANTYWTANRGAITEQVADDRLAGLILQLNHPEGGDASRMDKVGKIASYQEMATLNQGYDTGRVRGNDLLNVARNEVVSSTAQELSREKNSGNFDDISDETWSYLAGSVVAMRSPDNADEARVVTEIMAEERKAVAEAEFTDDSAKAGFVRESIDLLPGEEARPFVYEVATAQQETGA